MPRKGSLKQAPSFSGLVRCLLKALRRPGREAMMLKTVTYLSAVHNSFGTYSATTPAISTSGYRLGCAKHHAVRALNALEAAISPNGYPEVYRLNKASFSW